MFFLVGFAWPREAIPESVLAVSRIFPSDFAVYGLVASTRWGPSLADVGAGLARAVVSSPAVYFVLALLSARLFRWKHAND